MRPARLLRTAGAGRVAAALAVALFAGVALGNAETRNARDLLVTVGALAGGAALAALASGGRRRSIAGALTAAAAVWLLLQRTDLPSTAILAGLLGAGAAMLAGRPADPEAETRRGFPRTTAAVVVVVTVVFAMYVGAETPGSHWFGGGITHGPHGTVAYDEVAITFDDGPDVTSTLAIMRILDAAHVKATFFEVGKAIDAEPAITRALYADGQGLGNHSYHHDQWRWLDPRYPELERTQRAFERAIGTCPAFYRPPHGERTPFLARVVNSHHLRMVLWDDSSGDWAQRSARTIARRIVRGARPGSIIVLHDGLDGNPHADRRVLVRAMPLILAGLREKHLVPVRLDRLIGGPAYLPCG